MGGEGFPQRTDLAWIPNAINNPFLSTFLPGVLLDFRDYLFCQVAGVVVFFSDFVPEKLQFVARYFFLSWIDAIFFLVQPAQNIGERYFFISTLFQNEVSNV